MMRRGAWFGGWIVGLLVGSCGWWGNDANPPAPQPTSVAVEAEAPASAEASSAAAATKPGDEPAWLDEAVQDALMFLVQPGTEEPEYTAEETAEVRKFFLAHPEYASAEKRESLAAHACGVGLEEAHAYVTNPPPKMALRHAVSGDAWRVAVLHATTKCVSDDFSWYTAEARAAATDLGVKAIWTGPEYDAVILDKADGSSERVPLGEEAFTILRAGKPPVTVDYGPGMAGEVTRILTEETP